MTQPQPPDRRSIGRSLKAARESRGLTQADVSRELWLRGGSRDSLGTVGRWESLGSIKLDDAMVLAAIYGMTLDELVSLDPEKPHNGARNGDSAPGESSATTSDRVGEVLAAAEASRESRRRLPKGSRRRQT